MDPHGDASKSRKCVCWHGEWTVLLSSRDEVPGVLARVQNSPENPGACPIEPLSSLNAVLLMLLFHIKAQGVTQTPLFLPSGMSLLLILFNVAGFLGGAYKKHYCSSHIFPIQII